MYVPPVLLQNPTPTTDLLRAPGTLLTQAPATAPNSSIALAMPDPTTKPTVDPDSPTLRPAN